MDLPEIYISNDAEADIDDAYIWYEMQKPGLGVDFVLRIDDGFEFISKNHGIFPKDSDDLSRHFLKRFPYSIYFTSIDQDRTIKIIAILHHKRNPGILQDRLK